LLEQAARIHPARQLQPQRPVIRTPGQQKPGRKDRLVGNQCLQVIEFHRVRLSFMITKCNGFNHFCQLRLKQVVDRHD